MQTWQRLPKGAFAPKTRRFVASPKTREFTPSTICRVHAISAVKLREGRGLSPIIAPLKTRRRKRVSPTLRRPGKCCVHRSHTRLYVDFSWDSAARKNRVAFGVNAP